MSLWEELNMDLKISQILNIQSHDPNHHFGRPFLTSYQIAIEFNELFSNDVQTIGKPIGGKGTGQRNSLAQYIALELSKRINNEKIQNIEGRFIHRAYLNKLEYDANGEKRESSSGQAYDLSIFRLRD